MKTYHAMCRACGKRFPTRYPVNENDQAICNDCELDRFRGTAERDKRVAEIQLKGK